MRYYLGADLGSAYIKLWLTTEDGTPAARMVEQTRVALRSQAGRMVSDLLQRQGLRWEDIGRSAAAGWGRENLPEADDRITDIVALAGGAVELVPGVLTVLDVGGQDTKAIRIGPGGRVLRFVLNDKCAAGTGRFLEMGMHRLGVAPEEFARLAAASTTKVSISSFCTVFAESEVVALVAQGNAPEDIARALEVSVVERVLQLAGGMLEEGPVLLTGGVALNPDVVAVLRARVGGTLHVPEEPQFVGARGAARIARDRDLRAQGGSRGS
jgi:predicted CoA-substrate-specific enzyme activase